MFKSTASLLKISDDLWAYKILPTLSAQQWSNFSLTCKLANVVAKSNHFWSGQVKKFFKEKYDPDKISQFGHFFSLYQSVYSNLSAEKKRRFYAIINGDLCVNIPPDAKWFLDIVQLHDAHQLTPLAWLLLHKQQRTLDRLFLWLREYYQQNTYLLEQLGWDLGHWSVVCNQPGEIIREHLEGKDYRDFTITPLHLAAQYGLHHYIEFLIGLGLDIHQQCHIKATASQEGVLANALHLAVLNGHVEITATLLFNKSKVDSEMTIEPKLFTASNKIKQTSLLCATKQGQVALITVLLSYKADPLAGCHNGSSPFDWVIRRGDKPIFDLFTHYIAHRPDMFHYRLGAILREMIRKKNYKYFRSLVELDPDCESSINYIMQSSTENQITDEEKNILKQLFVKYKADLTAKHTRLALPLIALGGLLGLMFGTVSAVLIEYYAPINKNNAHILSAALVVMCIACCMILSAVIQRRKLEALVAFRANQLALLNIVPEAEAITVAPAESTDLELGLLQDPRKSQSSSYLTFHSEVTRSKSLPNGIGGSSESQATLLKKM